MTMIGNDWDELLADEWQKPYYQQLSSFLKKEYENGVVYPPAPDIFNALKLTPYEKVKVVILGQDPYHEPGQAQGLSFSVPHEVQAPPSLINIMKELYDDLGIRYSGGAGRSSRPGSRKFAGAGSAEYVSSGSAEYVSSGSAEFAGANAEPGAWPEAGTGFGVCNGNAAGDAEPGVSMQSSAQAAPNIEGILVPWAREGVLLLNTVMTVRAHKAGSHKNCGWEQFTDKVIELLAARSKPMVFVLWGANAGAKTDLILRAQENSALIIGGRADMATENRSESGRRHLIIRAPHPSPLSAYRGFFGGRYFSRCNYFLQDNGVEPVDWSL